VDVEPNATSLIIKALMEPLSEPWPMDAHGSTDSAGWHRVSCKRNGRPYKKQQLSYTIIYYNIYISVIKYIYI
jgi:hypothetical protein